MSNVEELRSSEHEKVAKADRARRLVAFIEEFGIQERFLEYERQLTKAMLDTRHHEDDARRHLRDAVHTVRFVWKHFQEIITEGELQQRDIDAIKKARHGPDRKKFF